MKDTSTQDQTLATVDPSVSSFDAKTFSTAITQIL